MKKLIISTLLLVAAVSFTFAQSAKVVSAFNYLKSGDLASARSAINEASLDSKTGAQAKTWYYRGAVYEALYSDYSAKAVQVKPGMAKADLTKVLGEPANTMKNTTADGPTETLVFQSSVVALDATGKVVSMQENRGTDTGNFLQEAVKSYEKSMEVEAKNQWKTEIQQGLNDCGNYAYNDGVSPFNNKDYQTAYNDFALASNTYDYLNTTFKQGLTDTFATLYAGNAALKMKKYDDAMGMYQKLLDRNIQRPELYASLGELYIQKGDTAQAKKVIDKGVGLYPDDKGLMVQQLNLYLFSGNPQEAIEKLKEALAKDPNFTELYIQLGNLYEQVGDSANARKTYKDAIAKDPSNFNGYYRLGASYYNEAVDMNNQMNKLDLSQQKQYDALKTHRDAMFKAALPYLEKAHQLDSKDLDTMGALKELYARLGMMDKSNDIKKQMEDIKGQ